MTESNISPTPREMALGRYFTRRPTPPDESATLRRILLGAGTLAVGFFFLITASHQLARFVLGGGFFGVGLVLTLRSTWQHLEQDYRHRQALSALYPQPTDEAVDQWLEDAGQRLENHSLERLGLTLDDCDMVDPLAILGPISWVKHGLEPTHVTWIAGADGGVRFGVYEFTYLWLAKQHLGIFCCDYDLIRDAMLNEKTYEFFYQDIMSISVQEEASALTLRTGQSLTSVQELRIAVASDPTLAIRVGAAQLKELTGAEWVPSSSVERVLSAIRKKMQDAKDGLTRPRAE